MPHFLPEQNPSSLSSPTANAFLQAFQRHNASDSTSTSATGVAPELPWFGAFATSPCPAPSKSTSQLWPGQLVWAAVPCRSSFVDFELASHPTIASSTAAHHSPQHLEYSATRSSNCQKTKQRAKQEAEWQAATISGRGTDKR